MGGLTIPLWKIDSSMSICSGLGDHRDRTGSAEVEPEAEDEGERLWPVGLCGVCSWSIALKNVDFLFGLYFSGYGEYIKRRHKLFLSL